MSKLQIGTFITLAITIVGAAVGIGRLDGRLQALEATGAHERIRHVTDEAIQQIQNTVDKVELTAIPVGTVIAYAGALTPALTTMLQDSGWLPCDGGIVTSDEFPKLFGLVGSLYGSEEDGLRHLPDLSGRTIVGVGPQYVIPETEFFRGYTLGSQPGPIYRRSMGNS